MSKEGRLIAIVAAVVVAIVGALVVFSGGDDDGVVNASDTSAPATSSTSEPAATSTEPPVTEAPPTSAPSTSAPGETTVNTTAPTSPASPPETGGGGNASGAGAGGDTGGEAPSVHDVAPWQTGLTPEVVRRRFDAAEASDDRCVRLVALSSIPDLNVLPAQPAADVTEYFSRWERLAETTQPQTDGDLAATLLEARSGHSGLKATVDKHGGTFSEAAIDELLGGSLTDLEKVLALFVAVANECPAPVG